MNTVSNNSLPRKRELYVSKVKEGLAYTSSSKEKLFLTLVGSSGSGKLDTVKYSLLNLESENKVFFTNGNKLSNGYFAGFYDLFLHMFMTCEDKHPEIIAKHEQSIKRLFPFLNSKSYQIPKDLTNTAPQDERTRFYHHQFQEKLLHGIYEFFLDFCTSTEKLFTIVIDNADQLSPTIQSLLKIMTYRSELLDYVKIVLLFDNEISRELETYCHKIEFYPLKKEEALLVLEKHSNLDINEKTVDDMLNISAGNMSKFLLLIECIKESIPVFNYLSFDTYVDFYLSKKGEAFRHSLLKEYINNHCIEDSPVFTRNYQVTSKQFKDQLHRKKIKELEQGGTEEQIMHLIHYVSLSSEVEQLTLLSPISIKLQEIGVYNTWFDLFSKYFINNDLRILPDGDELHNAVFVRMSFILYSLGISKLSIPYLEFFYNTFSESKLIPMILYSQSMTYGRYQIPVDLDKAEKYALMNLEKIDSVFKDHPKYVYLKVFAENAYAYICARQGRFEKAIELCTVGLEKMKDIYGESKYALHQSILVYNTAQVYEILGNFDKAYEIYQYAIKLDPYYGEYYNDLANLLQNHGHVKESLIYYQKAIDLCPPYYEAHINRAGAYEKMGDFDKAKLDYKRAIELKPDASYAYGNLSTIYYQEEKYTEALELIDKALYHNSKEAHFYNNKGLILQELDLHDSALNCFNKAIELNPKLSEAFNNAAVLAYSKGEYEESLVFVNKAIEMNPDPDYKINRGILYKELNQAKKALDDFESVRKDKQDDSFLEDLIKQTSAMLQA